jgi:hypothetical protein
MKWFLSARPQVFTDQHLFWHAKRVRAPHTRTARARGDQQRPPCCSADGVPHAQPAVVPLPRGRHVLAMRVSNGAPRAGDPPAFSLRLRARDPEKCSESVGTVFTAGVAAASVQASQRQLGACEPAAASSGGASQSPRALLRAARAET